jgi:hypothetical protein
VSVPGGLGGLGRMLMVTGAAFPIVTSILLSLLLSAVL